MRIYGLFFLGFLLAAAAIFWRYVPSEDRGPIKQFVGRNWWIVCAVIGGLFAVAVLNSLVSLRIF